MKKKINKNLPRFILLDDDMFGLTFAKQIIRNYSRRIEVITFSAAHDAIKYMETEDFMNNGTDTVLLTDLHMPEIDGFALLDRMDNTFATMKHRLHIFVLSAAAGPDEIRKVLSYDYVIGFLKKPFSKEDMEQIMDCMQYPL